MSGSQGYAAVPNWLVDDPSIHPHDKLVYMVFQRHADKYGASFPGVSSIAAKLGISESSVKRSKARLEAMGLIEIIEERRYGGSKSEAQSTIYKVHSSLPTPGTSGHRDPSSELSTGQGDLRSQGAEIRETPDLRSQGPLNKTQKNNPRGKTRVGGNPEHSPGAPVDNSPPRPLTRADRCVDHQQDHYVAEPCPACRDAKFLMAEVERDLEIRPLPKCREHGYAAPCPHCPGGRLYGLESA